MCRSPPDERQVDGLGCASDATGPRPIRVTGERPEPRPPAASSAGSDRRAVTIGLVVGLPVSAVFLWLAFRRADLSDVWSTLRDASTGSIALAVCMVAAVYVLQAERWRRIARVPGLRHWWFVRSVVAGVAVNNVLPGRLGDLLRARWLSVDGRLAGGRAFATVIIDRAFDVAALVALLLCGLAVAADASWLRRIALGGLAALAGIAIVLGFARLYTSRRARSRRAGRGLARRLVRDTLEGLAEPLSVALGVRLGALSVAAWGAWACAAWLVAQSVGIELSPLQAAFVTGVVNLGVAIPSSPGFIGTYQWLAVSALGLFDVGREDALAFAILVQAVWYVPTTLVGGAFVVWQSVRRARTPASGPARDHSSSV